MNRFSFLAFASMLVVSSCSENINYHGVYFDKADLNKITLKTKGKLEEKYGKPSYKRLSNPQEVFYMGYKTRTRSILPPEIIDRTVTKVLYNKDEILEIQNLELEPASDNYMNDETPTPSLDGTWKNLIDPKLSNS